MFIFVMAEYRQIEELVHRGTIITRYVDKATWRNTMESVIQELKESYGKDKINAIIYAKPRLSGYN